MVAEMRNEGIKMKVMKFGGTSVGSAEAMKRTAEIILRNERGSALVVLSALRGITDNLIELAIYASRGETNKTTALFESIQDRHNELIHQLFDNDNDVSECVAKIYSDLHTQLLGLSYLRELTPKMTDKVLSFGELLSSSIFFHYILIFNKSAKLLDAREIIKTSNKYNSAKPILTEIRNQCKKEYDKLCNYDFIITQGFIGSDTSGNTTTLGRGGSDLSASLFAYGFEASELEIWTDVSGVLSYDPRVFDDAKPVREMSASEIRELSLFGAKVLHPDTIAPAVEANIEVKILNTFAPEDVGTRIKSAIDDSSSKIHSLNVKKNCALYRFSLGSGLYSLDKSIDILNIIKSFELTILTQIYTSSSMAIIVETNSKEIQRNLEFAFDGYEYNSETVDTICIVGNSLTSSEMISGINNKLRESKTASIELFSMGQNDEAIYVALKPQDSENAIKAIHDLILEG